MLPRLLRQLKTIIPLQVSAMRIALAMCLAFVVAFPIQAQDVRFETPTLEPAETLGGSQFNVASRLRSLQVETDQTEDLEDIEGEVVPNFGSFNDSVAEERSSGASLSQPNFGAYGPVSGTAPTLDPSRSSGAASTREEVISRTPTLPNQYRGESFFHDWTGSEFDSAESSNSGSSSRPSPVQSEPERSVVQQLDTPRLQIDDMQAIQRANQDFDESTHEIIRERYPDGSIKIVRTIAQDADGNYYNDGGWLMYDTQKRPIASGTFVRGAMEGDWERVHESGEGLFSQSPFNLFNGPYISRANFVRNQIDGVWTISDRQGKLIASITYQTGVRTGLAAWYYPSGKKMREATFKDGVPNGFVLQWDQQGKLNRREQFVDGRRVIRKKSTYPNQQLAGERVFRDKKLTPQGSDNWWAAKPATFEQSGAAVQYGPVAEWYPNRQPKMTGRYVEGERDGKFTWWHETHNKKAEGQFSVGKRTGLWRYWHESGMKRSEGRFDEDEPIGIWRSWNAQGRIVDEKDFSASSAEFGLPDADEEESVFGEPDSGLSLPDGDGFVDPEVDFDDDEDPFGEQYERDDPRRAVPLGFRSVE